MNSFDVIVIGSGPAALSVAHDILQQKKTVALVRQPGDLDFQFRAMLKAFATAAPVKPDLPTNFLFPVFEGPCRFSSPTTVTVGEQTLASQKIVLACGVSPVIPVGVETSSLFYPWQMTTETFPPTTVHIIGGGFLGVALAQYLVGQKHRVTLQTQSDRLLSQAEPEMADAVLQTLQASGVTVQFNQRWAGPASSAEKTVLATGIQPAIHSLNLAAAKVFVNAKGVVGTTEDMQTTCKHVWAIGKVRDLSSSIGQEDFEAGLVSHNLFSFYLNLRRLDWEPIPKVLPLIPTLATVGLGEVQARERFHDIRVHTYKSTVNVPGSVHEQTAVIKIIARKRSKTLVGVHIYAPHAAELILFVNLAKRAELSIPDLMDEQHYPQGTGAQVLYESFSSWLKNLT